MEKFIDELIRKKIPENIIDMAKGETIIKIFSAAPFVIDFKTIIGVRGGRHIILTNMRLILLGSQNKNNFGLHISDVYCDTIELDSFKTSEIKNIIENNKLKSIIMTLNSENELELSSDEDSLNDFAHNFKKAFLEKKSIVRFPRDEHILFKSSLGMNVLPDIVPFNISNKLSYRNYFFNNALNITLCLTNKRILLYHFDQFDEFHEIAQASFIKYGKPKLQYISIPYTSISHFKKGKKELTITLSKSICGFELPSTNFYSDDNLYFEQNEYKCTICGKNVQGEISNKISVGQYNYDYFLENKIIAWKCSNCGQLFCNKCKSHTGLFSSKIRCPKCKNEQKPILIQSSCYKVCLKDEGLELSNYEPIKNAVIGLKGLKFDDYIRYNRDKVSIGVVYHPLNSSKNFNPFFNNILRSDTSLKTLLWKIKPTDFQIIDIEHADEITSILHEYFPNIQIQ